MPLVSGPAWSTFRPDPYSIQRGVSLSVAASVS